MPVQSSNTTQNPDLRILHLEDNPMDAELVRVMLVSAGIKCTIMRIETWKACEDSIDREWSKRRSEGSASQTSAGRNDQAGARHLSPIHSDSDQHCGQPESDSRRRHSAPPSVVKFMCQCPRCYASGRDLED